MFHWYQMNSEVFLDNTVLSVQQTCLADQVAKVQDQKVRDCVYMINFFYTDITIKFIDNIYSLETIDAGNEV